MARNKQQNEKMREERMESIRAEALTQFSERGFGAARIADIAVACGMAQGLLYHYYPSKEAIFTDLIDDALNKLAEAAIALRDADKPAREKLLAALRELLHTIATSPRFNQTCRFLAQAINSTAIPEQTKALLEQKRGIPYRVVAEIMAAGQREGSVVEGNPQMLATLFWTSINGLAIYYATRTDVGEVPDYRILAKMFLKEE